MTARDFDPELVADIHDACEPDSTADEELRATVHALVDPAVRYALRQFGPLPELRSPAFLAADPLTQRAVLLVCGEAYLLHDPRDLAERIVDERMNAASKDVAAFHDAESDTGWPDLVRQHLATQRAKRYRQQHPYGAGGDAA